MSQQYFAQIDEYNIVLQVHVVMRDFLEANPDRYTGTWIETFFQSAGKTYAEIGYLWNGTDFVAPVIEPV